METTYLLLMKSRSHVIKVVPRQIQIRYVTNCSAEEGEIEEVVLDEETAHWPVPPRLRNNLNRIKYEYRAVPLSVYVNGRFVKPADVNDAIKGALVEIHFELHHFSIRKAGHDSFNATIEQILVLRPGEPRPTTVYKRKNPRDGPIEVKASPLPQKQSGDGTSKTDENSANKENEGPSLPAKRRTRQKVKELDDGAKSSISDKRRGKQKAKESEDEIEEHIEN